MKFKKDTLIDIINEEPPEGYEIIEEGSWVSEGKYEVQTIIFKVDGKFYELTQSRTGSHFTDWYYSREDWDEEEDCTEVRPVKTVTTKWQIVKK